MLTTTTRAFEEYARLLLMARESNFKGDAAKALEYAERAALCGNYDAGVLGLIRAQALCQESRFEEANALFDDLIRATPPSDPVYQELLTVGWNIKVNVEDYEAAFATQWHLLSDAGLPPGIPKWEGQELAGKTIVVGCYGEGLGDYVAFGRFLTMLEQRGANVIVQAPPTVRRLLELVPGVSGSVPFDAKPDAHYAVRLVQIPKFLGISAKTIPTGQYIFTHPANLGGGLKVGLCWGAGWSLPGYNRSTTLAELGPLAALEGVKFYSLQKGSAAKQLLAPPSKMEIIDLAPTFNDLADTASAIAALDAVVSVDSMVANLAGALGKPTFVLLPKPESFRWGLRGRVNWYKSARPYPQDEKDQWGIPIARLTQDLRDFLSADRTNRGKDISPRFSLSWIAESNLERYCRQERHKGVLMAQG